MTEYTLLVGWGRWIGLARSEALGGKILIRKNGHFFGKNFKK